MIAIAIDLEFDTAERARNCPADSPGGRKHMTDYSSGTVPRVRREASSVRDNLFAEADRRGR